MRSLTALSPYSVYSSTPYLQAPRHQASKLMRFGKQLDPMEARQYKPYPQGNEDSRRTNVTCWIHRDDVEKAEAHRRYAYSSARCQTHKFTLANEAMSHKHH